MLIEFFYFVNRGNSYPLTWRQTENYIIAASMSVGVQRLFTVATWLILPVVVCLAQELSHASLSMSPCTTRLQMAAYNSYGFFDGPTLLG